MSHVLFYYQRPEPATWVFLSSFLLLSIYFVFHRFFCVRNLDIVLLLLLAPGLMMVYEGRRETIAGNSGVTAVGLAGSVRPLDDLRLVSMQPIFVLQLESANASNLGGVADQVDAYPAPPPEKSWSTSNLEFYGFVTLLVACALLMVRMLIDPALVRRPLLVPNLTIGGLGFIGISLFVFLMANVITSTPREQAERGPSLGPGYPLLNMLPSLPTTPDEMQATWPGREATTGTRWLPNIARILSIVSNLAIVIGIIGVGYWHFDNVKTGIGCAVMYLLLPYTAQMTGNLEHVMPAALMVLAMLAYRQPVISGVLFGLAGGLVYYPLFLLPLWLSFYWHRGLGRLIFGIAISLIVLAGCLLLGGLEAFGEHISRMFGLWLPRMEGLEGIWAPGRVPPDFRLPVLAGCVLLSASFAFWPSRKNLGSLMCGTAAIMLAVQFWHGYGGGLYMAWFLPFTLLTVFRPNLDDRIAINVVRNNVPAGPRLAA